MALNLDLRRLADSLAAATDPEVASIAAGQSGQLPRVFGLSEGVNRKRVREEAEAEAAEAQQGQPSMVDQYLQMYQQAMSGGPPQPPQGMPQGMPPQMPQGMPQGQMPRQMPPGMPQGPPPRQQGIGSMMPPQQPPRRPMPQGMPQGMPPGMGQGMPQGPPPRMGMARGGSVRGYAPGGGVTATMYDPNRYQKGDDVGGEFTEEVGSAYGPQMGSVRSLGMAAVEEPVEVTEEDQSLISDAIEWAKENPLTAAEYGLTGLFALATIPVSGTAAAVGVIGAAAWRRIAAKQLGKKAMSLIRSLKPTARAAKRIDKRIDLPDTQLTPRQLLERKDLIAKEARAVGREYAGYGGLATIGASQLFGGEDGEAPGSQEFGASPLTGAEKEHAEWVDYGPPAPDSKGKNEKDTTDKGFFDNISNAGWMGIINAGLSLAAPQGDSQGFGQDLANAAKSGLGTFTEQTASDLARTNDELDRDIMREQALYDIEQRGRNEAYMDARTAALGSTISAPHASKLATEFADSGADGSTDMTQQDIADLQDSFMRHGRAEGLRLWLGRSSSGSIPKHTDPGFMSSFKFGG